MKVSDTPITRGESQAVIITAPCPGQYIRENGYWAVLAGNKYGEEIGERCQMLRVKRIVLGPMIKTQPDSELADHCNVALDVVLIEE